MVASWDVDALLDCGHAAAFLPRLARLGTSIGWLWTSAPLCHAVRCCSALSLAASSTMNVSQDPIDWLRAAVSAVHRPAQPESSQLPPCQASSLLLAFFQKNGLSRAPARVRPQPMVPLPVSDRANIPQHSVRSTTTSDNAHHSPAMCLSRRVDRAGVPRDLEAFYFPAAKQRGGDDPVA